MSGTQQPRGGENIWGEEKTLVERASIMCVRENARVIP